MAHHWKIVAAVASAALVVSCGGTSDGTPASDAWLASDQPWVAQPGDEIADGLLVPEGALGTGPALPGFYAECLRGCKKVVTSLSKPAMIVAVTGDMYEVSEGFASQLEVPSRCRQRVVVQVPDERDPEVLVDTTTSTPFTGTFDDGALWATCSLGKGSEFRVELTQAPGESASGRVRWPQGLDDVRRLPPSTTSVRGANAIVSTIGVPPERDIPVADGSFIASPTVDSHAGTGGYTVLLGVDGDVNAVFEAYLDVVNDFADGSADMDSARIGPLRVRSATGYTAGGGSLRATLYESGGSAWILVERNND